MNMPVAKPKTTYKPRPKPKKIKVVKEDEDGDDPIGPVLRRSARLSIRTRVDRRSGGLFAKHSESSAPTSPSTSTQSLGSIRYDADGDVVDTPSSSHHGPKMATRSAGKPRASTPQYAEIDDTDEDEPYIVSFADACSQVNSFSICSHTVQARPVIRSRHDPPHHRSAVHQEF